MYILVLIIVLACAAALLITGLQKHSRGKILSGALLAGAFIATFFRQ